MAVLVRMASRVAVSRLLLLSGTGVMVEMASAHLLLLLLLRGGLRVDGGGHSVQGAAAVQGAARHRGQDGARGVGALYVQRAAQAQRMEAGQEDGVGVQLLARRTTQFVFHSNRGSNFQFPLSNFQLNSES